MMSVTEKPTSSSSASLTITVVCREVGPLPKDPNEKKQSFTRNVVSLTSELKKVHNRLAAQEQCFVRETLTRQEVETKAKIMENEISRLLQKLRG